jgi:precorrin-6B methylase 1
MVPVTQSTYDAIMEVRESGACNMFDQQRVLRLLNDADEAEAWLWVYNHQREYLRALSEGFDVGGQGDPRLSGTERQERRAHGG